MRAVLPLMGFLVIIIISLVYVPATLADNHAAQEVPAPPAALRKPDPPQPQVALPPAAEPQDEMLSASQIQVLMTARLPELRIIEVALNEKLGLYQVLTDDFTTIMVSLDGSDFIVGDHYGYDQQGALKNLSSERRRAEQFKLVTELPEDELIIFPAVNEDGEPIESDNWLVVFTDIDCGYCRRLHTEMAELNSLGIEIRYAFFPRSGPDTRSFAKAVNVWCGEDQQASMTAAKAGLPLAENSCENPVGEQFELGRRVGVRGTPTIWSSNGRRIGGYLEPQRLLNILQES